MLGLRNREGHPCFLVPRAQLGTWVPARKRLISARSDDKTRAEKIELVRTRFDNFAHQQNEERARQQDRSEERDINRSLRREGPRLKR